MATWNDFDYPENDHTNCPFASHMRKTKPRSGMQNFDVFDIMRRGIPYGPELRDDERDEGKTKLDRGLMFLCYQTSLQNGFQFLRNRKSPLMSR
jgi:deferrochelatase/peroxidase EfeB